MIFDPELFQQGENAFLTSKRQQQEQAQADFDRLRAIGDTEGMRRAGKNMQGGLLSQLFGMAKDPYGSPDPQGQAAPAAPGIHGMNVGGMVRNNMNATDIYDNLQKTFEGDIHGAKNNEERARLFRSYNEKVRQADNIFGWKNADGLNVKDFLVSSGGGGGKVKNWNIRDSQGNFVNTVQVPEGMTDEKEIHNYLVNKRKTTMDKAGNVGDYTMDLAGDQNPNMRQMDAMIYNQAEQQANNKAIDRAQGWGKYIPGNGLSREEQDRLSRMNLDEKGNPVMVARKNTAPTYEEVSGKKIKVGGKEIKRIW